MKRNDWSTDRMMDVNESWRTVTHFFAGYLANERIKDWYKMPSAVPQQCRHGLSSWKRWFLLEIWESIFIMDVNIERKLPRLHEKELQALFFWTYQYNKRETCAWYLSSPLADATFWCAFLSKADGWSVFVVIVVYLELDKNAHILICISVFITKVILISREPDDNESGRTVHTFSLVIRIHRLNQEYIQIENVKAHLAAN